jgi:flavin-dependent dehydrogenase
LEKVDVAIIGAGPAGSTLAALLAGRGVGVALVDRDEFPRDKLCGEFLSYDALPILERLGLLDAIDDAGAPRIARCRVAGARRTYEFAFPHEARGVSRLFLDDLLHRTAVARGARAIAETATSIVGARMIAGEHELEATVLVGAWGRWGRFDGQLGRSFVQDRVHRNFGFKRHYRSASSDRDVIELHSFPRGYLGVSGIEGGLTNICGLVHASRLTGHKGRWDAFVETIRRERAGLDAMYARHEPAQEGFLSSEPVIFRARSPVERGVVMIGDASGVIDPLTGNGMAMAIQSALVAAPFVLDLLARAGDRVAIERAYTATHRAMFASRIAWSRRVAMLLSRPALLDAALRTIRGPAAGKLLLRKTRATREEIARLGDAWFRLQ